MVPAHSRGSVIGASAPDAVDQAPPNSTTVRPTESLGGSPCRCISSVLILAFIAMNRTKTRLVLPKSRIERVTFKSGLVLILALAILGYFTGGGFFGALVTGILGYLAWWLREIHDDIKEHVVAVEQDDLDNKQNAANQPGA